MVVALIQPAESQVNTMEYQKGDIFVGTVSHMLDHKNFFVVNNETSTSIHNNDDLVPIFWIPCLHEAFVVHINGDLIRAVRVESDAEDFMKIRMLDTGETVSATILDFFNTGMYQMPEKLNNIPPLALQCEAANEHDELLEEDLYKKVTIEVLEATDLKLVVNVLPYDNTEEDENEMLAICAKLTEGVTFTNEDIAVLNEEPLNTDNIEVAVMGFESHDENLCKFYDPATGGCFKGGRCTQTHLPPTDDTYRDSVEVGSSISEQLPLPKINSLVEIEVTSVRDGNNIFCRYVGLSQEAYNDLMQSMNDPKEVKTFQPMDTIPAIHELVLVKLQDGKYYRARFESETGDYEVFNVTLVDEGKMAKIQKKFAYKWIHRFGLLPFQCVAMEIANIMPVNDYSNKDVVQMKIKDVSLNKPFKAMIVENAINLKCLLFNAEGQDVGRMLIDVGAAKLRPLAPVQTFYNLPG